jgi:hypothetical protein
MQEKYEALPLAPDRVLAWNVVCLPGLLGVEVVRDQRIYDSFVVEVYLQKLGGIDSVVAVLDSLDVYKDKFALPESIAT